MPPDLHKAHVALDRAVDHLYRRKGFATERERVEHLFALYERVRALLAAGMKGKRKRRLGANLLRPYPDDGSFRVGNVNSITPDMSSWKKFIITLYPMI